MCDTYIPAVGYICRECKNEFEKHMSTKGEDSIPINKFTITKELETFMDTSKGTFDTETVTIRDFFAQHTS